MVRISRKAADELKRRYVAKTQADADLASYLLGILLQLGIDPETYIGFDDESRELLLKET